ncbi:YbaB/EbfC family nucleoid-associated protein [Amycolatopsis pigmentata]|uniref:YbaB/EbfC family nucleoid-associated protein n=1 Tax=Amycolatopsis pigmentata TaxID=450801 RepID=A0ABW5FM06_9PSEU
MSDPLSSTDGDPAARLDRWAAEAKAKAQRYQAMRAQVGQVSVTESSKDGTVTVTVDSAGNVTDLRITDAVKEMSGSQAASAVLLTLRKAQSRLPEKLAEVMTDTIGDDPQTMNTIVGNYRAKFPEPEPDDGDEATPEQVRPIGRIEDDAPPPPSPSAPPPPPPRPAAPPRKREPADEDDDDGFGGQSFLVRE